MVVRPLLRIAVLECDEPAGKTKERYGNYGGLFQKLLENGVKKVAEEDHGKRPALEVSRYDVVKDMDTYPTLEDVDAVLLTGSKYDSFDDAPWILKLVKFTQEVLAQDRVRVIGVCFGHQIIGRALGAKVGRSDKGWEVSVVKVKLTGKGRDVLGVEELNIHQMHRDIVYTYPDSVQALGHTDRCDVQGMYSPGKLISVQGHPEFDGEIVTELLERRHDQEIFGDDMFKEGMSRVMLQHDGVAVGAAFIRFLLEQ